jgi:hypothetical protein
MQPSSRFKLKFPGLAELAEFALGLHLGFVIDTGKLTLRAMLSQNELELAINRFHGTMYTA